MKTLLGAAMAAVLVLAPALAETGPRFGAEGITLGAKKARSVFPGAVMTIYGKDLAPAGAVCESTDGEYPEQLCGTSVLVGGVPAGMMYVSARQVNFRAPRQTPDSGMVEVRVVVAGGGAAAVEMPAGPGRIELAIDGEAYTGMPVWLRVEPPQAEYWSVRYPYVLGPAGFGCNDVEVRKDGHALPRQPGADWYRHGITLAGFICGSYALRREPPPERIGRMPIHLLYRFDQPGRYEVRFTRGRSPFPVPGPVPPEESSAWFPFEVKRADRRQRERWLAGVVRRGIVDATDALTDVLPEVLGVPDEESFRIVENYLYHPDRSVRGYALGGLSYWPEAEVARRIEHLIRSRGPSEEMVLFLSWTGHDAAGTARASLPFLDSNSPVILNGVLRAASLAPAGDAVVRAALLRAGPRLKRFADPEVRAAYGYALARAGAKGADRNGR